MIRKKVKVFCVFLCLMSICILAQAETSLLEDINIEKFPEKIEISFTFDRPTKIIFYTAAETNQIVADIIGDARVDSPDILKDIEINCGDVKDIKVFKDITSTSKGLADIDFFVISLKNILAYTSSSRGNTCNIYIGTSKDISLSQLKPEALEPEVIETTEDIRVQDIEAGSGEVASAQPGKAREIADKISAEKNTFSLAKKWRKAGYNYQKAGDYDNALEAYKKAIEFYPEYDCVHNDLGIIYYYLGMPNDALREFNEVIRINPDYLNAYSNLALIYEQSGDNKKAAEYWQKRMELSEKEDYWTNIAGIKLKELK